MTKIDRALVERLSERALESVRAALDDCGTIRCASPLVTLLLRQYAVSGRDDFRDGVGEALARAMHAACVSVSRDDRSAWLSLFVEAVALSEDERLLASIDAAADTLAAEWPASGSVASIARAVDAALGAARVLDMRPEGSEGLLARAVDEMERVVSHAYTPGEGLVHALGARAPTGGVSTDGDLADHAAVAATLVTAYTVTGRLPYGMLADDLMQFAKHRWWSASGWTAPFAGACEAARVMCRLAALARDDEYREAAVLSGANYGADAECALAHLAPAADSTGEAALYGLAAIELLAIQSPV